MTWNKELRAIRSLRSEHHANNIEPNVVNNNTVVRESVPKDFKEKTLCLKFIQNIFPKKLIRIVKGILTE
jgi:hypothetical protein